MTFFLWQKKIPIFFWNKQRDPLTRPIDQSIAMVSKELSRWNQHQRREIITTLMKREWSDKHHIHLNPQKKKSLAA